MGSQKNDRSKTSGWEKCANLFLYNTLGSYIRAKAVFHNYVLARERKGMSIFRARAGPDHLIYESAKYHRLREIYEDIRPMPKEFQRDANLDELASRLSSKHEAR